MEHQQHDAVNHPGHYIEGGIEVIDVINAYSHVRGSFALGNAIKYILRAGKKDPSKYVEDLRKAAWYLNNEINYRLQHDEKPAPEQRAKII